MYTKRHLIAIAVISIVLTTIVIFWGFPQQSERPPRELPKELTDACVGKAEGDSCTIESFAGTEESTCEYMEDQLACFPHRMPPPDMGEPLME